MSRYWLKRVIRHAQLAALSAGLILLIFQFTRPPDLRSRVSLASAYVALIFLGASLFLGPWNLFRSRPNPVSSDVRRDVGIWAGVISLFHTGVGLTVHLRGRMWMYFFAKLHPLTLQRSQFGFANAVGAIAALFFIGLLLLSNDLSLRSLGLQRWKTLQRGTYVALALTFLHGWAYQTLEKQKFPWIAVFWSMTAVIVALQLAGMRRRKVIDATLSKPREP